MKPEAFVLDTPLLVLLVVGSLSPDLVEKHERLSEFSRGDFDRLVDMLAPSLPVVTAQALAETSNLLFHRALREPLRSRIAEQFRVFVNATREATVPARASVSRPELSRLGFTDCALIEAARDNAVLLTPDGSLHSAALFAGRQAVFFAPLRRDMRVSAAAARHAAAMKNRDS